MLVVDKVTGAKVRVAHISKNGSIYHLINSEGVVYRRFSDEVEEVGLWKNLSKKLNN